MCSSDLAAVADYDGDGRVDLVVTQNGAPTKLYRNVGATAGLRVRLQGPPDNPTGIGAQVRPRYGEQMGPLQEIHGGSGYWSQDSSILVLGRASELTQLWVRWPGGKVMTVNVPRGARELSVDLSGAVRVEKAGH